MQLHEAILTRSNAGPAVSVPRGLYGLGCLTSEFPRPREKVFGYRVLAIPILYGLYRAKEMAIALPARR